MSSNVAHDIDAFPEVGDQRDQLRVVTCGGAGDGKSALLDRLLAGSKTVSEDPLSGAEAESQRSGITGDAIDVTYRNFETDKRKFIAAEIPGQEQDTRDMAAGASTADIAIVVVDGRYGLQSQTRRHSYVLSLLGIRHVILAVNKMDLVKYDEAAFTDIATEYQAFAEELGIDNVECVPISALTGENVISSQGLMPWYSGATLMELLEAAEIREERPDALFRMPVQQANQSGSDPRGFSGTISAGQISCGDTVAAALTGKTSTVRRIVGSDGDLNSAVTGQSVTIVLDDEIDVSRGDMLVDPNSDFEVSDQFAAHVIWMDGDAMLPERTYTMRVGSATATAQVTDLVHHVDVNTLDKLAAKTLEQNEVGYCKFALDRAVPFDSFQNNRQTGSFVLLDKLSNATVGAGVIDFALRRASNIEWHDMKIDKSARARANEQKPMLLWFTGLSGSGKSTVADRLEQKLHAIGKRTYLLDGDNVRHGLNKDLGFTDQDRVENIRRVAEVGKLMVDAGLIVISSFISPFRSERHMARSLMDEGEFIEVFVDTPLEVCEQRDPKGLYKKARAGELKNFTGIDSDYEVPQNAELVLKAGEATPDELADQIIAFIRART